VHRLKRWCPGCKADVFPQGKPRTSAVVLDARSEAEIRIGTRKALTKLGWDVLDLEQGYRPHECRACGAKIAGGTRVPLGTADLAVMGFGVFAWIEVKRAGGRQTPDQLSFERRCKAAGVPYVVARSESEAVEYVEGLRTRMTA